DRGVEQAMMNVGMRAGHGARSCRGQAVCRPARARRPPEMKVRDAIRLIEQDGWYHIGTRGSHRQYKHPRKAGRVTVAVKPSDDLAPGTLNSILLQAGLKEPR